MAPQSWLWQECNKTTILLLICAYKHTTIASTLIFIFDSSVKKLSSNIQRFFPSFALPNSFFFSYFWHKWKASCMLVSIISQWLFQSSPVLVVLSLTDFWISSPHFCAKTLAGQLSSLLSPIFISANDLLTLSLEVYHYVLQFGCFREVDILSRLSQQCLLVSIFEIVAPPFAIPTMKARSSSLTSFSLPIFQLWPDVLMIYLWLKMVSNAVARTKNLWDRHTSHK